MTRPPTVRGLTAAGLVGRIVAVAAAVTVAALWLGIVVGVAVRTVRVLNGW